MPGTPFLMAAEITSNVFLFRTASDSGPFEELDVKFIRNQNVITTPVAIVKPTLLFVYNPLYDLESVWWIIVYVLFFNDSEHNCFPDPTHRQRMMEGLFHGRLDVTQCFPFLQNYEDLADAKKYPSSYLNCSLGSRLSPNFGGVYKLRENLPNKDKWSQNFHPSSISWSSQ
ncbi:hypothetical protein C8R41DRAFT_279570 [Lentinula lateritia]|uniref:Uncharacterized protein n=1 Tax=Lentinula lateritia TaxID=40482 RepID=A0ABQ8VX77_9AGAR|nr:hypothetical protein C8R41DRAFT_279570 [Lentinula lateritia]